MPKLFTLDEARSTLPLIRRIAADMEAFLVEVERSEVVAATVRGKLEFEELPKEHQQQFHAANRRFQALAAEFEELGVEIKGLKPVLVDFRSLRDGQEVFLCWASGESDIAHWHTLEGGFKARQPL